MKKIVISIVLILSIILTQISCYASVICDTPAEVLYNLDIIQEIQPTHKYMTRSDCVKMAVCMIDYYKLNGPESVRQHEKDENYPNLSDVYADMAEQRDDYYFFENLSLYPIHYQRQVGRWVSLPIIQGDGKLMRPDNYMTWDEFVTFFIRLLNWDVFLYLKDDMTYPDSYLTMAEKIGWNFKKEGNVTFGDAYDFVYDIIQTPVIAYIGGFRIPENIPFGIAENTILCRRDIYITLVEFESEEQEEILTMKYSLNGDESLVGRKMLVFEHPISNDDGTWRWIVDAIIFDDIFEYKGEENGIPEKMISPGIIRGTQGDGSGT